MIGWHAQPRRLLRVSPRTGIETVRGMWCLVLGEKEPGSDRFKRVVRVEGPFFYEPDVSGWYSDVSVKILPQGRPSRESSHHHDCECIRCIIRDGG